MDPMRPLLGVARMPMPISNGDYLQLLDCTGRQLYPEKCGRIAADAPAALRAYDTDPVRWAARVEGIGNGDWRAVGTASDLLALAEAIGQCWLKGLGFATRIG
jgi:hypothetical protein